MNLLICRYQSFNFSDISESEGVHHVHVYSNYENVLWTNN